MEKQQKILQMAKDICRVKHICTDVCEPISACDALKYAERAVDAGYVKQSEGKWIVRHIYDRNWDSFYNLTCPECSALFRDIPESEISSRYKFCSVCGAKMKGADNE